MRVKAARIGQYPEPRRPDRVLLETDCRVRPAEGGAVRRDSQHRQPSGTPGQHPPAQQPATLDKFRLGQLGDADGRAADEAGQAKSQGQQLVRFVRGQAAGREPGLIQRRPPAIARRRERRACRGGGKPGVGAAEQHHQVIGDHVGEAQPPSGFQLRRGEPSATGRYRLARHHRHLPSKYSPCQHCLTKRSEGHAEAAGVPQHLCLAWRWQPAVALGRPWRRPSPARHGRDGQPAGRLDGGTVDVLRSCGACGPRAPDGGPELAQ